MIKPDPSSPTEHTLKAGGLLKTRQRVVVVLHVMLLGFWFRGWFVREAPQYTDITIELAAAAPSGGEQISQEGADGTPEPEVAEPPPPEPEPEPEPEPPPPQPAPTPSPTLARPAITGSDQIGASVVPSIDATYTADNLNNPLPTYPPRAFLTKLKAKSCCGCWCWQRGKPVRSKF